MVKDGPKVDRENLDRLIEAARKAPPMSASERAAQRRSWVRGNLMLKYPEMAVEEAERRARRAEKELYGE